MPTQSQYYDDSDPPISQAVQIWAEGPEIVPYAAGFKPPYPQALQANYSGYGSGSGSVSGSGDTPSSSQLPDPYDLSWVASDTAEFQFFFADVCWTDTDPSPTVPGVTWEKVLWSAQVRTTYGYYYGYWWPPVFPLGGLIMQFGVTSQYMENDSVFGTGTMVTLTGGTLWPGTFNWDLQADTYGDPVNAPDSYTTRTWLQGKATVTQQVTSPMLVPPSNWPIYKMSWQ
jgi:hypothetical protein